MVKIQVLGNGLIPRMGMLAPITEPFPVGRMTAATILQTSPNLTVNYLNPNDGKFHALTNQNITRVFDEFEDDEAATTTEAPAEAPVVNETPNETPAEVSAPAFPAEPEVNDAPVESDKSEMVSENTESDETSENTEDVEENDDLSPVEGRNAKKKNKRH